jgi:CRP-like cAMP-binding protein
LGSSRREAGQEQPAAALASSPLLASIAPGDLNALVRAGRAHSWHVGQLLFQRGDAGDGMYAIVSGHVRIVLEGPSGAEVTVRRLDAGDVFGELSALDGQPRSATAVADSDVRALHISPQALRAWLQEHPAVAVPMLSQLAYRLRTTNDQVAEIGLLDVETRIARRLSARFAAGGTDAFARGSRLRLNQREFAAELGVTRESVNKHLARLKARGVISLEHGTVILLDPRALARATEAL